MSRGKKPSEGFNTSMSIFEDYPARTTRLSGKERRNIKRTARELFLQSPGDAIGYLASQRGYTNFNPDALIGKLSARDVDYEKLKPIAGTAFQDLLNRPMTDQEFSSNVDYARAMGVKDPGAFQSLITERIALANPDRIKSQANLDWERTYGPMARAADGSYQPGRFQFNQGNVSSLINTMLG